jgi:hypothetical protein
MVETRPMMSRPILSILGQPKRALALAAIGAVVAGPALAECVIKDSPCYPWRIEQGAEETVLLEVVPNNAITGATYRVCLCPPTRGVSIVFDFRESARTLGTVESLSGATVCRDFRILTSRSSRLKLKRADKGTELVEGCFVTY